MVIAEIYNNPQIQHVQESLRLMCLFPLRTIINWN